MTDIEDRITHTLADEVDAQPHVERLLAGATAHGRTLRRRRRVATGGVVTGVTVAVAALVAFGLPAVGGPPQPHSTVRAAANRTPTPAVPHGDPLPTPPEAVGAPTGASDPAVVGSDPMLFHLGLSWTPKGTEGVTWSGMKGVEIIYLDGADYSAAVMNSEKHLTDQLNGTLMTRTTTLNGRTAHWSTDENSWHLSWQPMPGVWAVAAGPEQAAVMRLAEGMGFDHVYQCSTPGALRYVPAGLTFAKCEMTLTRDGTVAGGIAYASQVYVWNEARTRSAIVSYTNTHMRATDETRTVRGHPAYLIVKMSDVMTLAVRGLGGFVEVAVNGQGLTEPDLMAMANGLDITGKPNRPDTWETRPVG